MAAGVEEDGAAGSAFERALAGEVSRARGEQDEVRRNTANSNMCPWATGASASVREDRLDGDVGLELRVELDVLGLDVSRRDRIDGDRSFGAAAIFFGLGSWAASWCSPPVDDGNDDGGGQQRLNSGEIEQPF